MNLRKELIIFPDLQKRTDYDFVIEGSIFGFYYPSRKKWTQRTGGDLMELFRACKKFGLGKLNNNIFTFDGNELHYRTNNKDEVVQLLYMHDKDNVMIDNKQEFTLILQEYTNRYLKDVEEDN